MGSLKILIHPFHRLAVILNVQKWKTLKYLHVSGAVGESITSILKHAAPSQSSTISGLNQISISVDNQLE
jgi:hypothetical protein